MNAQTELITSPTIVAFGRDEQGLYVDSRWEERVVVMVCVAKDAPRPFPRTVRVEERTYCTLNELVTAAKDAVAEGKRVIGQVPSFAKLTAERWGVYVAE